MTLYLKYFIKQVSSNLMSIFAALVDVFSSALPRIVSSWVRHGTGGVKRGLAEYLCSYLFVKPPGLHISISMSPPLPPPFSPLPLVPLRSVYLSLSCSWVREEDGQTGRGCY